MAGIANNPLTRVVPAVRVAATRHWRERFGHDCCTTKSGGAAVSCRGAGGGYDRTERAGSGHRIAKLRLVRKVQADGSQQPCARNSVCRQERKALKHQKRCPTAGPAVHTALPPHAPPAPHAAQRSQPPSQPQYHPARIRSLLRPAQRPAKPASFPLGGAAFEPGEALARIMLRVRCTGARSERALCGHFGPVGAEACAERFSRGSVGGLGATQSFT